MSTDSRHGTSSTPQTARPYTLVLPGFGESGWLLQGFAQQLAEVTNQHTIPVTFPRWGRPVTVWSTPGCPSPHYRQYEHIRAMMALIPMGPVDVVAHSAGAISAIKLALDLPDTVRSLHLIAPSGFLPNDSGLLLAGRVLGKSWNNYRLARAGSNGIRCRDALAGNATGLYYLLANPWRALREARSAIQASLAEEMNELTQRWKNVVVWVYLSENDSVFPPSQLNGLPPNVLVIPDGCHDDIYLRPTVVAQAVSRNLTA